MKSAFPPLILLLSVVPVAVSREADISHYQPLVTLALRSYGEPPDALADLLDQYFYKHHMSPDHQRSVSADGSVYATYHAPSIFDEVAVKGQFNCIFVTYYSWLMRFSPPTLEDSKATTRAAEFRGDLLAFLSSLPAPKIQVADVEAGAACEHAF
jgi:hypothetical protein